MHDRRMPAPICAQVTGDSETTLRQIYKDDASLKCIDKHLCQNSKIASISLLSALEVGDDLVNNEGFWITDSCKFVDEKTPLTGTHVVATMNNLAGHFENTGCLTVYSSTFKRFLLINKYTRIKDINYIFQTGLDLLCFLYLRLCAYDSLCLMFDGGGGINWFLDASWCSLERLCLSAEKSLIRNLKLNFWDHECLYSFERWHETVRTSWSNILRKLTTTKTEKGRKVMFLLAFVHVAILQPTASM